MEIFERALEVLTENFSHMVEMSVGSSRDGIVSVRDVHAYYKDGKMYFLSKTSNTLMHDIAQNPNVGLCHGVHTMQGVAKSLGHPTEPQNAELRKKLKKEFSLNYDEYVSENDSEMRIVEVTLTYAQTYTRYHRYEIDFAAGSATRDHSIPRLIYR